MNEEKKAARVLVVDDEDRDRRLLVAMLEAEGYATAVAADGMQALERVKQSPPDMILLDVMMPGMDGYEVARALKADAATQAIPIIMVTLLDDRASRLRGLAAGAEEFVNKPVDRNELRIRVRNLLRLKHFSDDLEKSVEERTAKLEAEFDERKRAEKRFHTLFEFAPDAVVMVNQHGIIARINRQSETLFGYRREDLLGQRLEILMPEAFRLAHTDLRQGFMKNAMPRAMGLDRSGLLGLRKDGTVFPVDISLSPIESEDGIMVAAAVRDVTRRNENEKCIIRQNRVLAVLSGINATIVRTRDRQELFDEACRIAVEQGKFRQAWIGLVDTNGLDVTPVARAGVDEGYLDNIQLTVRDDAPDRCEMVARAIREKTAVVCNDIATDLQMARWREEALRRGYRSVAVLPLPLEDKVMGLLLLYAPEAGFFDTQEMRLLTEIADDISFAMDHIEKTERLNYLAYYDALTGLANRSLFLDRVAQYMRSAVSGGHQLALFLVDLDRFKNINDSLGRSAGDALLRQVAQWLTHNASGDLNLLSRVGADHFALVMPVVKQGGNLMRLLEKWIKAVQNHPFRLNDTVFRIAVKVGVAVFPDDGADVETLFRNAEAALKKAKASGEHYLFYASEMNAAVARKLTLENKLRRAVERGELVLHYQPKVELKTRRISGLEALMRWNDPDTGRLVPPIEFITLLEETGLIVEAGFWALEQAIADSARWKGMGLQVPRIAVNVSAIQLRQKDFVATVERALEGTGPGVLELEITESLIMQDVDASIEKLRLIRAMGVEISIDDFGTGYSALSYLSRLPINALKIDRGFIINMTSMQEDMNIVSTIISLGHSLKLKVIAEGVETEEQANLLWRLKCNVFQGDLFSRPVPVEEIETLLQQTESQPVSAG